MNTLDVQDQGLRAVNATLQGLDPQTNERAWSLTRPMGQHAIACGLDAPLSVSIEGHVGFYCAGMNQHADITVNGHAGVGVAENMMSGMVRVCAATPASPPALPGMADCWSSRAMPRRVVASR